jgi:hypothetical protein
MPEQHIRDMKALTFYREAKKDHTKASSNTPDVRHLSLLRSTSRRAYVKAVTGLF